MGRSLKGEAGEVLGGLYECHVVLATGRSEERQVAVRAGYEAGGTGVVGDGGADGGRSVDAEGTQRVGGQDVETAPEGTPVGTERRAVGRGLAVRRLGVGSMG